MKYSADKKDKKKEKVKDIDNEVIQKQIECWKSKFQDNNERGREMISFITQGEQWDSRQTSERWLAGKESLTFNICWKEMKKMKSQIKEIEFSLDVFPTSKDSEEDVSTTNAFGILMDNIILEKKVVSNLSETFERCIDFGYSFGQVDFRRMNNSTLSLYPVYIHHNDPTIGFWDTNACSKTKIDGQFSGITRILTGTEIKRKYPKIDSSKCLVKPTGNVVVDYWFRQEIEKEFCLLLSGEYKRKDFLTFDDKNSLMTYDRLRLLKQAGDIDNDFELEKKGFVDCIYFKRICNWVNLENPKMFPTDDLPLLYHPSCTFWTPDNSSFTIPFGYHLQGAQKLYNFVNSQIATQSKACTSDKWLFEPEHVESQTQLETARNINKIEGGVAFGGDISRIRRERPSELSMSLIQMSQTMKQVVDEIGGAQIDANNAQQTVISGVALDKITKNMKVINDESMANHILFTNDVGKLYGQMLPRVVTEQRTMVVKMKDGTGKPIIINQELGTGEIGNDITDINNKFEYDIKAGASGDIEKENMARYLTQAYQLNPGLFATTADIYFRNLNGKDSGELALRALAAIDPNLVKFSQGLITQDEYNQSVQRQQKQQQIAHAEALRSDPTYQSAVAMSAAETEKAKAAQKNSDTTRIKVLAEAIGKETDRDIEVAKVLIQSDKADAQKAVSALNAQLSVNDQMIDRMREVIGDNDLALEGENQPGAPNDAGDNAQISPDQEDGSQQGDPNAG